MLDNPPPSRSICNLYDLPVHNHAPRLFQSSQLTGPSVSVHKPVLQRHALASKWDQHSPMCGPTTVNRSENIRIHLKIAKKQFCLYLDIFSCVKINVFCSFFAFRLKMYVRCDNQYQTGADGGNILGQRMLFVSCVSAF